jgi:membrane-bound serine protease (ClpP class)
MTALGIILILLAIVLVIGELHTGSGILIVWGIVSLIFGIVILFKQESLFISINLGWIILLIILIIGLIIFSIWRIISIYRRQPSTGREDLKGKTAIVKETLNPKGTVFYQGEYWNAVSKSGKIETGEEVIIENVDGLMLNVERKPKT